MLELKNMTCGYGSRAVLEKISFSVETKDVICILGANGIGKTTLFKSILGHIGLLEGEVLLEGSDIRHLSRRKVAQIIGYVPQAHTPPFPYRVLDVVTMGRTAHISVFSAPSKKDFQIAKEALERLNISHLKHKNYTEISGGERQLVLIARALAQEPKILIMDEPTANLDFGNQIKMLECVSAIAKSGLAVMLTTHFPDHAFWCSNKVVVLKGQNDFVTGKAENVLTNTLLREIYGVKLEIKKVSTERREVTTCVPC